VLGYTRRQLVIVGTVVAVGAGGLAIDHWRRANPDVVGYLETLDRAAPASTTREPGRREPLARRAAARPLERENDAHGRGAHADDAPLDVNLATAADFERLPGVGPALAARIVDVRAREGPFGSVEDLRRVRGVGRATLERLRPRLAVNTP